MNAREIASWMHHKAKTDYYAALRTQQEAFKARSSWECAQDCMVTENELRAATHVAVELQIIVEEFRNWPPCLVCS